MRRSRGQLAVAIGIASLLLGQAARVAAHTHVVTLTEPVSVDAAPNGATLSGDNCLAGTNVDTSLGQPTVNVYDCGLDPATAHPVPIDGIVPASRVAAGLPPPPPPPETRELVADVREGRVETAASGDSTTSDTSVGAHDACRLPNVELPRLASPSAALGAALTDTTVSAAPFTPGGGSFGGRPTLGGIPTPPPTVLGGPLGTDPRGSSLLVSTLPNVSTVASTAGGRVPGNLASIVRVTNTAAQAEFLDSVVASAQGVRTSILADDQVLNTPYKDLPLQELGSYLERAKTGLGQAASALLDAESGLDKGELRRFGRIFLDAEARAGAGAALIRDASASPASLGALVPFAGLSGPRAPTALARSAALAEIFGADPALQSAATADGLVNRLIQLNGLPPGQRAALFQRLKLAERAKLKLPSGQITTVEILHNGYIFGDSATGMDCSSFVSSALPTEVRKGRLTTLDFRTMWMFKRSGNFPHPPSYPSERRKMLQGVADGFVPLDIYNGDKLAIGDLLVYRPNVGPSGHVFVIRGYNPRSLIADVIEASQSAGTIRERAFPLSTSPTQAKVRLLRPGLLALRLKPQNNEVCSFRPGGASAQPTGAQAPARARPTHGGTSGAND